MTISEMRKMFDELRKRIPYGRAVAFGSEDYDVLRRWASIELAVAAARRGILAGFYRRATAKWVRLRLSGLGWKIGSDGAMVQTAIPVHDVPTVAEEDQKVKKSLLDMSDPELALMGWEGQGERVRRLAANTGYVVDPQTGRKLPPAERWRVGY